MVAVDISVPRCINGESSQSTVAKGTEIQVRGTHDKAECEPRIALDDMRGVVTAVVTLARNAFVAFDLLAESMLAAGEY